MIQFLNSVLVCAMIVTLSVPAYCQVTPVEEASMPSPSNYDRGWLIVASTPISPFYGFSRMQGINSRLKSQGIYSSEINSITSLNYGVGYWVNRWMFSGDFGFHSPFTLSDYSVSVDGTRYNLHNEHFFGAITGGYQIFQANQMSIHARGGAGYAEHFVQIQADAGVPIDINQLGSSGARHSTLVNSGGFFDVNLTISHRPSRKVSLGQFFVVGYRRGFSSSTWEGKNVDVINSPGDRIAVFYVQLNFIISLNRERL